MVSDIKNACLSKASVANSFMLLQNLYLYKKQV